MQWCRSHFFSVLFKSTDNVASIIHCKMWRLCKSAIIITTVTHQLTMAKWNVLISVWSRSSTLTSARLLCVDGKSPIHWLQVQVSHHSCHLHLAVVCTIKCVNVDDNQWFILIERRKKTKKIFPHTVATVLIEILVHFTLFYLIYVTFDTFYFAFVRVNCFTSEFNSFKTKG